MRARPTPTPPRRTRARPIPTPPRRTRARPTPTPPRRTRARPTPTPPRRMRARPKPPQEPRTPEHPMSLVLPLATQRQLAAAVPNRRHYPSYSAAHSAASRWAWRVFAVFAVHASTPACTPGTPAWRRSRCCMYKHCWQMSGMRNPHSRVPARCKGPTLCQHRRRPMHHHTLFTSHSRLAASCAGSTQSYLAAARRRAASTCPHAASTCAKHPAAS